MEQTSKRIAQLTLLSRLGQSLGAATDLASLCTIIPAVLLEYPSVRCVILRPPQQPDSQLKPAYIRTDIAEPSHQVFLLQQEKKVSDKVLASGQSQFLTPLDPQGRLPVSLYCLPLRLGRHQGGSLSFIGGNANNSPFGLDQQQLMSACAFQIAQAVEQQLTNEHLRRISVIDARNAQQFSLLYRISQRLHSTLATEQLMHLILSLLVHPQGGDFQRAMLFMVNSRSQSLQGILGVTRESAALVLPEGLPAENIPLLIHAEALNAQKQNEFSRQVMQLRLPLDHPQSCLAKVVREQRSILIQRSRLCRLEIAGGLTLEDHACVPLIARQRVLCVLVVDNFGNSEKIDEQRLRFLELFAAQAGIALDNAQLVNHIEAARKRLHETQDRLLQREKMATIGEMSASIAHELRNPLASLGGFARRLHQQLEPGTQAFQYADIIHTEAERLEKMLDVILSFARLDTMKAQLFTIGTVIEQALLMEQEKLADGGIALISLIADDFEMEGDPGQIEQVLINLISNARQAMPTGGTLTLKVDPALLGDRAAVAIEIRDTGTGIAAENMRNLFTPFFTTHKQGTGLGLPICQRIIQAHQGELQVANAAQGPGAIFTILLPLQLQKRPGPDKKFS